MKLSRKKNPVLTGIFSVLIMAFVFSPVIAGDNEQSMRQVDQAMETRGQRLQEKVAVQLQQAVDTEIVVDYENQVVQQASDQMEQVALAISIDPEVEIQVRSSELLAQVVPTIEEVECDD